jgi:hypothetical protein
MAEYRSYSDDEKSEALAAIIANSGNLSKTARDLQIPISTLFDWHQGDNINSAVTAKADDKKAALASRLDALADLLAGAIPDKIEDAPLTQVATSMGICIDKARLLREQPTPDAAELAKAISLPPELDAKLDAVLDALSAGGE